MLWGHEVHDPILVRLVGDVGGGAAFGVHTDRLAEQTSQGPEQSAEPVDAVLALNLAEVDVELDVAFRVRPEDGEESGFWP
jgi:hypothetical protein